MNPPDPATNLQPQMQQLPVRSQHLNTSGIHLDANHMNPAWSNRDGHLPIIPAAGSPHGQPMNPSSHYWNEKPYYTGPNGQPVYPMQLPQQPLQTHQPVQQATMIYSMENQRKAERNEEIKNRMKKECIDGCRAAVSAVACVACFVCGLAVATSY
jgi:hypothetical protein